MDYEERITCFIDLLGFKSTIEQTLEQVEIRSRLYKVINSLDADSLLDCVHDDIPFITLSEDGTTVKTSVKKVWNTVPNVKNEIRNSTPLTITQFSDSFVISCPINNRDSCRLLLTAIYLVNQMFFFNLGMMMRGGISIGLLTHEENGALYGPSMIEAYELESKSAIYPRIIISPEANYHLGNLLKNHDCLEPLKTSFDGHVVIDLISIFSWKGCEKTNQNEIEIQLKAIEQDILNNSPAAHPKISYLLNEWKSSQIKGTS